MLNPIEKFKRSILHLYRSLHHWCTQTCKVTRLSPCGYLCKGVANLRVANCELLVEICELRVDSHFSVWVYFNPTPPPRPQRHAGSPALSPPFTCNSCKISRQSFVLAGACFVVTSLTQGQFTCIWRQNYHWRAVPEIPVHLTHRILEIIWTLL